MAVSRLDQHRRRCRRRRKRAWGSADERLRLRATRPALSALYCERMFTAYIQAFFGLVESQPGAAAVRGLFGEACWSASAPPQIAEWITDKFGPIAKAHEKELGGRKRKHEPTHQLELETHLQKNALSLDCPYCTPCAGETNSSLFLHAFNCSSFSAAS
eukprot:COSAG01_NODE_18449_length_1075_cov_1.084016_1_plen_159_part_00